MAFLTPGHEPYPLVMRRAANWLLFLAPFFYLTYGGANWLASVRGDVGSVVTALDRAVPFLAWTIVPYWSINLFYAVSLFACDSRAQVDRLAGRLLVAQVVAVACFLAFPLQVTFVRPAVGGLSGFLFDVLAGFDLPYNQAPSLHIALLVIIWHHLAPRFAPAGRLAWHAWCALIGASVLTTWQHHAVDIPTGALLGLFALWLVPEDATAPLSKFRPTGDRRALRLAAAYGGAALLLVAAVATLPVSFGWSLWLLWPALALAIVAFAYLGGGPGVFQKRADGTTTLASRLLLAPVRAGARLNALAWTRGLPAAVPVVNGVHLGRLPGVREAARYGTIVDLTAELSAPPSARNWHSVPMLDLVRPDPAARRAAVAAIDAALDKGPVLVCCALGFQRSAETVMAWLVASGRATDDAAARRLLEATGRRIHLSRVDAAADAEARP